ncbi:MAG: DUF262 domain-containing protein [Pirellulaceae bacterium]|nr:DUF262 domain-containing protein [Pirellulaceae bacterium]
MDISPDKQNIDRVFSNTTYYIDFYQRDYRWDATPVLRLLDDVFFKFRDQYEESKDLDPGKETITAKYPWYYLNTYVTNIVDGRVYVVDGQQRLTTLSLILMKLRLMAIKWDSQLKAWIEGKIAGTSGYEHEFWMNHVGHKATQNALFEGKEPKSISTKSGITAVNLVANFQEISAYLNRELSDKHQFETFVFYFLHRLVLINLSVEQTDVSMVFEVINDRGVRLRPYEILKGKLLGQIDKIELDKGKFNELWESQASAINQFKDDEMDSFFRFYLKAKFASSRKDGQKFDGDYHRAMFSSDMEEQLKLNHNPTRVKSFLKDELTYFAKLYVTLLNAYTSSDTEFQHVYFNGLLDLDAPFLLTLSACDLHDPNESEKIQTISREIDRYIALLQLQNAYDSNEFADTLYTISLAIRNRPPEEYRKAFDDQLTATIAARRNVTEAEPFSYVAFKQTGINLNTRFKRFFFARIDLFLAENLNVNPKHEIGDLVTKTGAKTGFYVEHILSYNEENLELFDDDEERFEQERNRLGGILLLKGKDNISSGNEPYSQKLKSYANTLYWNETLRRDSYKSKLDMVSLKRQHNLKLEPLDHFGPNELEQRHRLLYEISRIIWE